MKKEIFKAAVRGDVDFLRAALDNDVEAASSVYSEDDLLGLTSHGNNIIHVAAEHGHLNFINLALQRLSSHAQLLISGSNHDGDTPLHLSAKLPISSITQRLIELHQQQQYQQSGLSECSSCPTKLWQIQNNKGNTALHEALINGGKSLRVVAYLLVVGPEVASYTNFRKEAPLHLAVDYDNQGAKRSMTNMVNKLNGLGALLDYRKCHFDDDSLSVIESLLEINATICCLQDENGMTPLLRAAQNTYLRAVESIIDYYPESVEMRDPKGRTFLHHIKLPTFLAAREFLKTPEVSTLMDRQDEDGNTPLHIALENNDYNMVKAMMQCNANFVIKNKEGVSAATLIQSESSAFLHKVKYNIKRSIISNNDELMSKELYQAAGNREWQYLRERLEDPQSEKLFLTRLPNGSNIIHVAVEDCPLDHNAELTNCSNESNASYLELFVVDALTKFPILSCQANNKGETPLHLAMFHGLLGPGGVHFESLKRHLRHIKDQASCFPLPPWKAADVDGDTLLHMALKHSRYAFAAYLIELDPTLVRDVNNNMRTPLHKLCRGYGRGNPMAEQEESDMVDLLLDKDVSSVFSYDKDGFTPLLTAAHSHQLKIAARILYHCPQSIKQFDSEFDRNLFHIIRLYPDDKMAQVFEKVPQMKHLLTVLDDKYNTPLHVAIEQKRFGTVKFLMQHIGDDISPYNKLNDDNKSVIDVLDNVQNRPRWFQDFLSSNWWDLPIHAVLNSAYGVHASNLKDYMSVIGIVAALLTTITFTAAFTVPGGYDQNKGTPIMAKKVAFQVFMVTDVVGMCSSMMTLFCLLWFLNSGEVEFEGSALTDLSIGLLQLSFYATLLAFMSGVYATTFPDVHWMAIFTCVLCSTVLVLLRKRFILDFVVYLFVYLYWTSKICSTFFGCCTRWIVRSMCHLQSRHQSIRP